MSAENQKTVLVTGSSGQLGKEIQNLASFYPSINFLFTTKENLDIENFDSIKRVFDDEQIDTCINCAAYTAVDRAETEKDLAFRINADAVGNIASVCNAHQAQLIHISTDYVFDGRSKVPYKETDSIDPINIYGASKLKGEEMALNNNASTCILRTSWVYSSHGNNFVRTMLRLMKDRSLVNVVNDQFGSPTYAADLANVIMLIALKDIPIPGLLNYSNEGIITWYEFALAIKEYTKSKCELRPITTSEFPTPAARPMFSVLDTSRIRQFLEIDIPNWKSSLHTCLQSLN